MTITTEQLDAIEQHPDETTRSETLRLVAIARAALAWRDAHRDAYAGDAIDRALGSESMAGRWVVTYHCQCSRVLNMPSARDGDLVLINRAWCHQCELYVTKAQARATSHFEGQP